MLLYVAKYTFMMWMMIGVNDADIMRIRQTESEDKNIYINAGCTVRCLQEQRNEIPTVTIVHFQNCYANCETSTKNISVTLQKIQENRALTIICRDEKSLSFQFEQYEAQNQSKNYANTSEKDNSVIYFIKIRSASDIDHVDVYLSNDEYFELNNLSENTTHNITAVAIHADNKYSIIAKEEQYMTLHHGSLLYGVHNIQINGFNTDGISKVKLTANLTWKPSSDISCYYEIVYYALYDANMFKTNVDVRNLSQRYSLKIKHLQFSGEYKLGVRSKHSRNRNIESDLSWIDFQTPSCIEWHQNNFNICAPVKPKIVEIVQTPLSTRADDFNLKIVWEKPKHFPDYYIMHIFLLKENGSYYKYTINSKSNSFVIPKIKLDSKQIEIHLTAYTPGGNSTVVTHEYVISRTDHYPLLLVLYVGIIFTLTTFLICYRLKRFKFFTHRCQFFPEERPQVLMDRALMHINDDMEIDSDKVNLFELLGEGAFGRVYRGVYNDTKLGFIEVAVKMLKDMPTSEDVNAFCCEIDVMKSVKKHPNIVGIVGHCTKDFHNMLLLTEYCCLGNLLFFLRDECRHLNENGVYPYNRITDNKTDLDGMNMNNKTNERESDTVIVSKQMGDFIKDFDVNVLIKTSFQHFNIEKTQPINNGPSVLMPISVDNRTYFQNVSNISTMQREPLNATILLDISKQIATGMEFLAKNKVVHRDLAARNVLLASNRIVKIADFGLSRDIYQENMYKKCSSGKLPIKWLALESLTHQLYTTKSDVWSYGILLYEIITLGGTPYPSIDTSNLLFMLKSGYRMEIPINCGQPLYNLMYRCWHENPAERPTFTEIIKTLERFLDDGSEKQIKNLISPLKCRPTNVESFDEAYLKPL